MPRNVPIDAAKIREEVGRTVISHDFNRGPLLLLAGPGTGKTFSLKETIRRQVANGRKLEEFYGMTLTNAAAGKFEDDVKAQVAEDFEAVSTVHFRAKGIVHKHAELVGLPKSFRILTDIECEEILDDIREDLSAAGHRISEKEVSKLFRAYQEVAASCQTDCSDFGKKFTFYRQFYNAVEWYDVILLACRILAENNNVRAAEAGASPFLLIDEYQDLNRAEQEFVRLLCNGRSTLLAVGDDDQSIYGGRFANASGIVGFQLLYPSAAKIPLPVCSRCPTAVLKSAYALIRRNKDRDNTKTELIAMPETDEQAQGGLVASVNLKSGKREAEFVATALRQLSDSGVPHKEILVLCSNRALGQELLTAIKNLDCGLALQDCVSKEKVGLDVHRIFHYFLLFCQDHADNLALRMLLRALVGVDSKSMASLRKLAIQDSVSLWDVASDAKKASSLAEAAARNVREFAHFVTRTDSLDMTDRADELAKMYAVLTPAVEAWKSDHAKSQEPDKEEKRAELEAVSGIRFMTLHSSKGLEARYVFIPFMESDVRLFAKDVEERRRLLYVGITRARTAVILSWAWSRQTAAKYKSGGGKLLGRTRHTFLTEGGIRDCAADAVLCGLASLSKQEQEWLASRGKE